MELEYPTSFYPFLAKRALADIEALWLPDRKTLKAGIKFVPGQDESGFPRFFVRDAAIVAAQIMHVWPENPKAFLEFTFAHQGEKIEDKAEEEPGKMMHEYEQSRRHPTNWPDKVYFSLDATPWTLIIYCLYYELTSDVEFVERFWPNVMAALAYIEQADRDGDGFVEYQRTNPKGLINQAWKDSHNAYCHRNGLPAPTPIAPVEVQGWVFLAKMKLSVIARDVIGDRPLALKLRRDARQLQRLFNEKFWVKRRKFLAQGLDADKKQIQTITTNAGQALLSGIVDPDKAAQVVARLMKRDVFTPWGLRTLSSHEKSYSPTSYHNGSVWPSDNWVCAKGFELYGFHKEAAKVRDAIFRATADLGHNPELYVVRERKNLSAIHPYFREVTDENELEQTRREQAAACIIQAWSAGAELNWLTAGPNPIISLQELGLR